MTINVLNEFLPPAEDIRRGAIKVGETLDIDNNNVLNVDSSAVLGSYYSNVITEIPQNIELQLNNGILTLKGGCKTYMPNGVNTFEEAYSVLDVTTTETTAGIYFILYHPDDGYLTQVLISKCYVSNSEPTSITTNDFWYDTTNNSIKRKTASGYEDRYTLPLGIITVTEGAISSINQVFNGAGYIGHHAFVLPGIRGLLPDGKTDKGTVKSILIETETVQVIDLTSTGYTTFDGAYLLFRPDINIQLAHYITHLNQTDIQQMDGYIQYAYDTNLDYIWNYNTSTYDSYPRLPFVEVSLRDSQVTYFNILQPLRIANTEDRIDTTGTFLFDYKWTDHIPNKLSWIDSSLFSWIDGNVYKGAYEELLTAWNGSYIQKTDNNVTYRDTVRGYQIAGPDQEEAIINAWNKYRIGWFYILDIPTKRFKLPRFGSKEIVETYQNGTTWYRLYTDDWVEQGGRFTNSARLTTITLPIPMLNNSYYASVMLLHCDSGWTATVNAGVQNGSLTTTSFVAQVWYNNSNTTGLNAWEVKGFSNFNAPTTSSYGPVKHLYFYLGYTDADRLKQSEIDIDVVTNQEISRVNTATEEGINRLNTDSNALNRTQITNCLEEIPQDIKLELNNGMLTLKAGSKLYVPNGFEQDVTIPHFDELIIQNDISNSDAYGNGSYMLHTNGTGLLWIGLDKIFSGTSAPSSPSTGYLWYDTTNNLIKRYSTSSTWESGIALPLGLIETTTTDGVTKINQVFNGFGYIGSSLFALPGIKFLAPNGLNADGTLNNLESTTTKVFTHEMGNLTTNGLGSWIILNADTESMALRTCTYDEANNTINYLNPYSNIGAQCVHILTSAGQVTRFSPKAVIHIPDVTANYYFYEWKGLTAVTDAVSHSTTFKCLRGNPIYLSISGDLNPMTDTAWDGISIYRDNVQISYLIVESRASSCNNPFCHTYLDTMVTAGCTYTYKFIIHDSGNGTSNFQEGGEKQCPKIIIYEL